MDFRFRGKSGRAADITGIEFGPISAIRPRAGCAAGRDLYVAAHVWDTIGAQSVGCSGALIARPGNAPLPLHGLPQPHAVAPDLPGVATQLINLWR